MKRFSGLFSSAPKSRPLDMTDPILGLLRWSEDVATWEALVTKDGQTIGFLIAGEGVPAKELVRHAQDIVRRLPEFRSIVDVFLATEIENSKHLAHFADEIRQLSIEHVSLMRPDRPNDGMIYFKGPDESRCWRCDYIAREPTQLGFDD